MRRTRSLLNISLDSKIDEAIKFLIKSIPKTETVFVGFSGGKDSVVIEKLMQISGLKYKLFYSCTGIDPPEVVRFIKKNYKECVFLKPKKSFWYYIKTHNPPLYNYRWCCRKLKKEPSWKLTYFHRVMGIRAEESNKRSKYKRINKFNSNKQGRPEHIQFYPIFYWLEYDVWEFIEKYDLPYCGLYDKGLSRIGCVVCPMHGKSHQFYKDHWPLLFKIFEKTVTHWFKQRDLKQEDK